MAWTRSVSGSRHSDYVDATALVAPHLLGMRVRCRWKGCRGERSRLFPAAVSAISSVRVRRVGVKQNYREYLHSPDRHSWRWLLHGRPRVHKALNPRPPRFKPGFERSSGH
jgi:hypothetical protein